MPRGLRDSFGGPRGLPLSLPPCPHKRVSVGCLVVSTEQAILGTEEEFSTPRPNEMVEVRATAEAGQRDQLLEDRSPHCFEASCGLQRLAASGLGVRLNVRQASRPTSHVRLLLTICPACLVPFPVQISYYSPVNPDLFGFLSLVLIGSGLVFMALFFVYEMKASQSGARSAIKELGMATASSFFLGFGVLFLTLWAGIYV